MKDKTEEFQKALMNGYISMALYLLENYHFNINARIRYTDNPDIAEYIALIWAAEKGYKEIVNLLLKQPDININIKDCQGFTALMCAAEQGHREVIELLLNHPDIDVNVQNNKGSTALMQAAYNGHKEVVKQLLSYPNININIKTRNGGTALDAATCMGHIDIANMLRNPDIFNNKKHDKTKKKVSNNSIKVKVKTENLDLEENYEKLTNLEEWIPKITRMRVRGIDFNSPQNSDGWTILMYATQYADIDSMKMILNEKDDNDNNIIDINIKNKQEDTALTIAIITGDEKKMKLLLSYDAEMKLTKNKKKDSNTTPVKTQNSLSPRNIKILILKEWMSKIIRMRRRKEDFNAPLSYSNNRRTILMCACATQYANCNVIKWILNEKDTKGNKIINVNAKDKNGNTALTFAAQTDDEKKMMLLYKNNANIKLAIEKAPHMVREKLENFSEQVQRARNDFIKAVFSMNYPKAKSLFKNNLVDVNLKVTEYGNTLLMSAAQFGLKEAVKLLLEHPDIGVNICDDIGITALMCGSINGYTEIVEMLLNHGADVNLQDTRQRFSALMCAAEKGHEKIVKMLLNHGANVNVQANKGQTALILAEYFGHLGNGQIKDGHMKVINHLLKHGADVNIKDADGDSALMIAVSQGCEKVVHQILEFSKADDNNKNLALMAAAVHGHEKIVRMLLSHKPNVNSKNMFGITTLMHAIKSENIEIIKLLLENGADVNDKDQFGLSTLTHAIRIGNLEIITLLLKNGADVDTKDIFGVTPLMFAIESGNARIVKLLLTYQKDIDFEVENYYGETLLSCAESVGRKKIIKLLQSKKDQKSQKFESEPSQTKVEIEPPIKVESEEKEEEIKSKSVKERFWEVVYIGDDGEMDELLKEKQTLVNERNKFGDTALIVCTKKGYINVMHSLLECKADVSLIDSKGDTALLIASDNGDLGAVRLLLSNGADPSFKDRNGDNALIRATKKDRFDVVEELIHRRPIINAQGKDNKTALMIAAEKGFIRLVKLLIKKDAKINAKDIYEKTALDIIKEKINNKNKKGKFSKTNNILENIKEILEKKVNQPSRIFEDLKTKFEDTWEVVLTKNYEDNLKYLKKESLKRIKDLIEEIKSDPFRGRGHPEPLKGNLKGQYSRRIDRKNRLVYEVDGEKVFLKSCDGHYKQENRKN